MSQCNTVVTLLPCYHARPCLPNLPKLRQSDIHEFTRFEMNSNSASFASENFRCTERFHTVKQAVKPFTLWALKAPLESNDWTQWTQCLSVNRFTHSPSTLADDLVRQANATIEKESQLSNDLLCSKYQLTILVQSDAF